MEVVTYSEKKAPMDMEFEKWVIDSNEVIEIAKNHFKSVEDFKYDEIWLLAVDDLHGSRFWSNMFIDSATKMRYKVTVDPFTGEIIDSAVW